MDAVPDALLEELHSTFLAQRELAERAIAQLDDAALFRAPDEDQNSVAILMKHVGGNLRSRWTDPLGTDGEKPDRDRDGEFEPRPSDTPDSVRAAWDEGWRTLDEALRQLGPGDLLRSIRIRGQPLTVLQALLRSLAHTAQHAGQIVVLARQWSGRDWRTLSIPRRPRT
jgi:hypothetical protein